jgi:MFS family permease
VGYLADLRTVIRGRYFRRLFAVRLISQFGDGIFTGGLAGYVFFSPEKQTSAGAAAAAFAVLLLPYSIVGPFAGVFIDRWSRRQVLVYSALVRTGLVAVTGALVATEHDGAMFYVAALAVLGVNRFFLSALSAALPHVVPRDELLVANAVTPTAGTVITFAGAAVGGVIPRLLLVGDPRGSGLALGCSALLYIATSLVATSIPHRMLGPDLAGTLPKARHAMRNVAVGLVDGVRHILASRPVAVALAAIAAHRFWYGLLTLMTALLYRNYFNAPGQSGAALAGFGIVVIASGAGFFVAAFITPPATRWLSRRAWITVLFATAAVTLAAAGLPMKEAPFAAAGFVLGVVSQSVKICVDTIVQESTGDAYRGRVFAVYDMLFNVMFVAAGAFAAATIPSTGVSYPILIVMIAGFAATAVAYWFGARPGAGPDRAVSRETPAADRAT